MGNETLRYAQGDSSVGMMVYLPCEIPKSQLLKAIVTFRSGGKCGFG